MAQPLYFLPHISHTQLEASLPVVRSILRERGLAEIFSDLPMERVCYAGLAGRGPGELSGTIVTYQAADGAAPRRIGYYPAEQKWTPVGDGSLCWIGVDTDDLPKPSELVRTVQHKGWPLKINGQEYLIPVIRRPDGHSDLPSDMIFDAAGKLEYPLKPEFAKYFDMFGVACEWWRTQELNIGEEDRAQALLLAIEAFGLNYRYTLMEHQVLRLIDKENFLAVLALAIDLPRVHRMQEAQKKT